MSPQQYRSIVASLLKIANTLHDKELATAINYAEAQWTGTRVTFERRAIMLLDLVARTIAKDFEVKET